MSINCSTEGATIYYTTNGQDPTTNSTVYSGAINVSTNTTIKAMAAKSGYDNSAVASATYTITTPSTIAEVRAQGTGSVFTQGVVTSCVGTTGYIQDNTAAICVYGSSLTIGDEITVAGTLGTYRGLLEITNPVITVVSQNNTVEPTVKTIAEINADDITSSNSIQGLYVTIEEATVNAIDGQNTTIAQGSNTIVVRGISGVEYAVNDVLTLNGNIGCFDVAQIANPQNVTVQEILTPTVTVTPSTINAPFAGAEGTLALTYENIEDFISFDYYFCDANGDELEGEDPDWIYAEINEENDAYTLSYIIDANDGEARTAYMKVYTTIGDELNPEEVYAIVTVTQAAYEAPHVTWDLSIDQTATATTTEMTWTSDYATMGVEKANSTTNTNNYYPGTSGHSYTSTRFYKDSELTISPAAGYAITSVVFTATTEGYASTLENSTWTNATASVDGTTVTVTPTDGATTMVAIIGGTCGFTQVIVYYEQHEAQSYTLIVEPF